MYRLFALVALGCLLGGCRCGGAQPTEVGVPCPDHPACSRVALVCRCDGEGNLLVLEDDLTSDGIADNRVVRTYDDHRNMLSEEVDRGADGTADRRSTFRYDNEGRRISEEVDTDVNGSIDERTTMTYAENGRLATTEMDFDFFFYTETR